MFTFVKRFTIRFLFNLFIYFSFLFHFIFRAWIIKICGEAQKNKLDAELTSTDEEDEGSFFHLPRSRKRNASAGESSTEIKKKKTAAVRPIPIEDYSD